MVDKKSEHQEIHPEPAVTRVPICVPSMVWGGLISRNVCVSISNWGADIGGKDNA